MPERGPTLQSRGILTALRAAAILIIATGLNDVVAGAIPAYEPLYLFLAALALITWLDGLILGLGAGALATFFYALLFMPRAAALSTKVLVPAGAVLATVLVVTTLRALTRMRSRRTASVYVPPATSLLAASTFNVDNSEVLTAIDALRDDLRHAVADLASSRDREATLERSYAQARQALAERVRIAEEERGRLIETVAEERAARLRIESAAREAAASLQTEMQSASGRAVAADARVKELEAALARMETTARDRIATLVRSLETARGELESVRGAFEKSRTEVAEARATADARASEIETARAAAEEHRRAAEHERARAEGERDFRNTAVARVTELERALGEARTTEAELRHAMAAAATERDESHAAMQARLEALERALDAERSRGGNATAIFEEKVNTLTSQLAQEHANFARSLEEKDTLRAELQAQAAKAAAAETSLNTERGAFAAAGREWEKRLAEGDTFAASLRARVGELEAALEVERAGRSAAAAEFDEKLAAIATHLAQDHEADIGKAVEEREAARAEARSLGQKVASLQEELRRTNAQLESRDTSESIVRSRVTALEQELDAARTAAAEAQKELDERMTAMSVHLAGERDEAVRAAQSERDSAVADTATLRARLAAIESSLQQERGARATLESEHVALQAQLMALQTEHAGVQSEHDRRLATLSEQIAHDHEATLQTLRGERDAALETGRAHQARAAELDEALRQERAAREAEAAQFDEKLNTIVAHLAHDHESDLGKAMEEKAEARAELRSVQNRLAALQKKVDEERQTAMQRISAAEERYRHSVEDSTRILAETRAAAQREIDSLRARLGVAGEQVAASDAPLMAPMMTPMTAAVKRRVLIAHPDADLRMNARASLERAGYEVLSAADGLDALRTAIAQNPDIVIADAVMPKMDGRELCQLLKSQEKTAHIRVVLLTRSSDAMPKSDLPPDEILRKPVPLETLKATLAALMP